MNLMMRRDEWMGWEWWTLGSNNNNRYIKNREEVETCNIVYKQTKRWFGFCHRADAAAHAAAHAAARANRIYAFCCCCVGAGAGAITTTADGDAGT